MQRLPLLVAVRDGASAVPKRRRSGYAARMTEDSSETAAKAQRALGIATAALIIACMAIALSILGLFLPLG